MTTTLSQSLSLATNNGAAPKEGPKVVPVTLNFATAPAYIVDLSQLFNSQGLSIIQGIYLNNTGNSASVTITVPDTGQTVVYPPYSEGFMPLFLASSLKLNFASTGGVVVQAMVLNFAVAPFLFTATGSGAQLVQDLILESAVSNGVMQTAITGNVSLVDASGTITTGGTAQTVLAANATRKVIQLQNMSAGPLWYNFSGTATEGGGSFELVAGAYYENNPGIASNQALSIIGATTGQAFTLKWA